MRVVVEVKGHNIGDGVDELQKTLSSTRCVPSKSKGQNGCFRSGLCFQWSLIADQLAFHFGALFELGLLGGLDGVVSTFFASGVGVGLGACSRIHLSNSVSSPCLRIVPKLAFGCNFCHAVKEVTPKIG